MATLKELIRAPSPSPADIAAFLDGLSPDARLAETRTLKKADQIALFHAVKGARTLTLDDLVPPGIPPMQEVFFAGTNSLPLFTEFSKVCCRPDDAAIRDTELWGYNRNSALIETPVGPGYYVVVDHGNGELLIDYTRLPPRKPEAWSPIRSNSSRISFFVYNHLQDVLRGVSKHVTVGHATRRGKEENNWFVLCRMDT